VVLRDHHQTTVGELVADIAKVLLVTVVLSVVFDHFLRDRVLEQWQAFLTESVVKRAPEYGLEDITREMKWPELFNRCQAGETLLWLDTFCPDYDTFLGAIHEAVKRGVAVKMLAVAPGSDVARLRADEIIDKRLRGDVFLKALGQSLETIKAEFDESDYCLGSFRLRLYRDLPCAPMYIHLNAKGRPVRGFTSYFLSHPSVRNPHLKWRPTARDSGFLDACIEYFDNKWNAQAADEFTHGTLGSSTGS
jgi:hypothetical protein